MRSSAMRVPTFTIMASSRCTTKPALSLIAVTAEPPADSAATATPKVSGVVSGVFITVRRPLKRPSMSTATVRAGSSLRRTAALEASSPSGVTKQIAPAPGEPPSWVLTPAAVSHSASSRPPSSSATQADAGSGCAATPMLRGLPLGGIANEAGRTGGPNRLLPDPLGEAAQRGGQRGLGAQAADHLDQPHQRRRIEEMQAGHPFRPRATGGDLGHRQRGGVGGE